MQVISTALKQASHIADKFIDGNPTYKEKIILTATDYGVFTNVPHVVIQHSPNGYEWGYGGSGPSDLALNLCELALRDLGYTGPTVQCWDGRCFNAAWAMHIKAKYVFISTVDRMGGSIPWATFRDWVQAALPGYENADVDDVADMA
jgi:hypothetical protein